MKSVVYSSYVRNVLAFKGGVVFGILSMGNFVPWFLAPNHGPSIALLGLYRVYFRWTPHPVIVTIMDNKDYIGVLLYSYYSTVTGWGVLLRYTRVSGVGI